MVSAVNFLYSSPVEAEIVSMCELQYAVST